MADPIPSQLEMMGRELKCPICLSLLNSAVSLLCNHVFCNSCILKSMKSGYTCPVCKVPYRRREVRPAPHMDNLVSIYKHFEVASGINMFVSQNAATNKLSDGENQLEDRDIGGSGDVDVAGHQVSKGKRTLKKKESRKTKKSNMIISSPGCVKPSFPTKKRVQVPQYPSDESLVCHTTPKAGLCETKDNETKTNLASAKQKLALNDKGEPAFLPFFWLREEEDVEKISQSSEKEQLTGTSPPDVPSFSDMKDSDDELPFKLTTEGNTNGNPAAREFYDSEMFEWTQRPCSPELCSSPIKVQVTGTKKDFKEASQRNIAIQTIRNLDSQIDTDDVPSPDFPSVSMTGNDHRRKVASKKRRRNRRGKSQMNLMKGNTKNSPAVRLSSNETFETCHEQPSWYSGENMLTQIHKLKMCKRSDSVISQIKTTDGDVSAEIPGKGCSVTEVAETPPLKQDNGDDTSFFKTGSSQKDHLTMWNERKRISIEERLNFEGPAIQDQTKENLVYNSSLSTSNLKESSTMGNKDDNMEGMKSGKLLTEDQGLRLKESEKCYSLVISDAGVNDGNPEVGDNGQVDEAQTNHDVRLATEFSIAEKLHDLDKMVLRKCGTIPRVVQCAFCQSSECSEASGEMVHYSNGEPVPAGYSGGSRIIHSHKNCTEWAPNVYFMDRLAINLEAEVVRSRRIKCCCCGIKGAALGCYEKSCRKSFHVTCAMKIPQCRWDTVNFVLLCPLHCSCKLPIEIPGPREIQSSSKEEQSQLIHDENDEKHQHGASSMRMYCGSHNKIVLCCSALTKAERDMVSQFGKASRAKVVQKWNPTVTHVIASADENGACKRTFKVLMGILEGKWILSVEWIKACMEAMEHLKEERYEINVDIHGMRNGPQLGRQRVINMQPKLFDGLKFYFMGDFDTSLKGYLQDLVVAAGGTVLHRKPIPCDELAPLPSSIPSTFIIYSLEMPENCGLSRDVIIKRRLSGAEALARSTGAKVASNSWLLDSIASCKLE
ncbi:protein BREAST CANCER SUSCEPTIBILITY 1 homolog [Rhodamnia argentea]|uniref:Protein BREAST CANCER SUSCEPTIBILITY 1 homolog n=1 Tax=Rhodamnia argentea TaxID=178133 RepID=A0ABM3HWR9_9MYRT|nr:protein BREAST CANCER SUSCEPTIBILITY 1 homolog [Rhodamnia argentea]